MSRRNSRGNVGSLRSRHPLPEPEPVDEVTVSGRPWGEVPKLEHYSPDAINHRVEEELRRAMLWHPRKQKSAAGHGANRKGTNGSFRKF